MSRPKSVAKTVPKRGSAAPARAGARPGVFVQTPKSDIYVVMLSIALGAMFLGSILLIMLLSRYDFKLKVSALSPTPSATAIAFLENSPTVHL